MATDQNPVNQWRQKKRPNYVYVCVKVNSSRKPPISVPHVIWIIPLLDIYYAANSLIDWKKLLFKCHYTEFHQNVCGYNFIP